MTPGVTQNSLFLIHAKKAINGSQWVPSLLAEKAKGLSEQRENHMRELRERAHSLVTECQSLRIGITNPIAEMSSACRESYIRELTKKETALSDINHQLKELKSKEINH